MEISRDKKTALLIGIESTVGINCLELLLEHEAYQKVVVFTRHKFKQSHPKLSVETVDFNHFENYKDLLSGNDLFCCVNEELLSKKVKTNRFKRLFFISFNAAKWGANNGVHQFLLLSSVGANKDALRQKMQIKAILEESVVKLPFWAIHVFRPSLILEKENENRWGEKAAEFIGRNIDKITGGKLSKYKPLEAEQIAKAMILAAQKLDKGIHNYSSNDLQDLAKDNKRLN